MTLKSIEKLRDRIGSLRCRKMLVPSECKVLCKSADEIEREISERYMELPLDADGVPIRVGDEMECDANGYKGKFRVFAVSQDTVVGDHDLIWVKEHPTQWFHIPEYCRHYKPRTLFDVLAEVENGELPINDAESEIRDLLGVSE